MDCSIGAPGHIKYVVDGINTRDKIYQKYNVYVTVKQMMLQLLIFSLVPKNMGI